MTPLPRGLTAKPAWPAPWRPGLRPGRPRHRLCSRPLCWGGGRTSPAEARVIHPACPGSGLPGRALQLRPRPLPVSRPQEINVLDFLKAKTSALFLSQLPLPPLPPPLVLSLLPAAVRPTCPGPRVGREAWSRWAAAEPQAPGGQKGEPGLKRAWLSPAWSHRPDEGPTGAGRASALLQPAAASPQHSGLSLGLGAGGPRPPSPTGGRWPVRQSTAGSARATPAALCRLLRRQAGWSWVERGWQPGPGARCSRAGGRGGGGSSSQGLGPRPWGVGVRARWGPGSRDTCVVWRGNQGQALSSGRLGPCLCTASDWATLQFSVSPRYQLPREAALCPGRPRPTLRGFSCSEKSLEAFSSAAPEWDRDSLTPSLTAAASARAREPQQPYVCPCVGPINGVEGKGVASAQRAGPPRTG